MFKIPNIKNIFKKEKEQDKEVASSVSAGEGAVSSDTFVKTNLSENDKEATKAAHDEIANKKKKQQKLIKRILLIVAIIIFAIVFIVIIVKSNKKKAETAEVMKNVSTITKKNISSEISGSGTLKPKDSYTITSLVEGNVTHVFFEQGDQVIKDQLLIAIDSSTAYRNIVNASSSVVQAQDNYNQSKYEYEKLEKDYEGRTYKAPKSGALRTFKVKAGDKLKNGTEIGSIYDDSVMTIKVPFLNNDANRLYAGKPVVLELQETGELLEGVVKSVAEESQTLDSGAIGRYVVITCKNPGGLTINNTALAYVDDMVSIEDGSFEVETDEKITFNDGSDVEIEKLLISEGAHVEKGTPLFLITEETFNNIITSKKRSYLQAKESLTKAENSYDDTIDSYDEYFITAPIDGTVIDKNVKVGDKIQRSNNNATTLASIYDLSELTFDMSVDELDISKVQVGQQVNVQADAFNNKIFNGVITNVSLVAENSNGVTNYPVTVTIYDKSELLPGMNVDAYVVLSHVEDAIALPADALQRGNVVYVLNSSPTIQSKNYNSDGISDRVKNRVPEGFTAINVSTGISNENFIEITEGLQEGDQVYVSESTSTSNMFGGRGMMGGRPMGGGGMRR